VSYDLSVWCVEPFRDPAALADVGAWKLSGNGWMIEGRGWLLHVGPSDAVLDEDLPDEVRGAMPGIAYTVGLSLEPVGAPKAAYAILRRAAKLISRAARGAVFDPQTGTVDLPPGTKRYVAPPPGEARISLLVLSWWFDHSDLLDRAAVERLFDILAAHAPEALPRRYGLYEPPQHALAETGREHAVQFLTDQLVEGVVWYCTLPFFHVSISIRQACGWQRLGSQQRYRCNQMTVELDAGALEQPGWQTAVRRLWRAVSLELRPFFGDVRSLAGNVRKGSRIWHDGREEPHPIRSWWWNGIPPRLGHAAVVGEPYRSLWPGFDAAAGTVGGLTFLTTDDWTSRADAADLVAGVPQHLALPFLAHWGSAEGGGRTVRYPETYPAVFPFGVPGST